MLISISLTLKLLHNMNTAIPYLFCFQFIPLFFKKKILHLLKIKSNCIFSKYLLYIFIICAFFEQLKTDYILICTTFTVNIENMYDLLK